MKITAIARVLDANHGPKRCCDCGRSFPRTLAHFYRSAGNVDGLEGRCKLCRRARNRLHGALWRKEKRAARVEQRPRLNTARRASPRIDAPTEGRCQVKGCPHDAGENGRFCTIPHHPRVLGLAPLLAQARFCYPAGEV
jgi:hypothetical protein